MGKLKNRVKQYTSLDDLSIGELVIDINRTNPSVSFMNEDYQDVVLRPVPDMSGKVAALEAALDDKADKTDLANTNDELDKLTQNVGDLSSDLSLTSSKVSRLEGIVTDDGARIDALENGLIEQNGAISGLAQMKADIQTNKQNIATLTSSVSGIDNKVGANSTSINELNGRCDILSSNISNTNTNVSGLSNTVSAIQNTLATVYKAKGFCSPNTLNKLNTYSEGDTYIMTSKGNVTIGSVGPTIKSLDVESGDIVLCVKENDSLYWKILQTDVDKTKDNNIYVIDGPQTNGDPYTINWLCTQWDHRNQAAYYLVTKRGYESMMTAGGESGWLPESGKMTDGMLIMDVDYNTRAIGTYQQIVDLRNGDIYTRTYIPDPNDAKTGKKWSGWTKILDSNDGYQKAYDDSLNASFGSDGKRSIVGAINSLKNTVATLSSAGDINIPPTITWDVNRTPNNNQIQGVNADSKDEIHLRSSSDNNACEDNIYLNVHSSESSTIHLGIKPNVYLKKDVGELDNFFDAKEPEYVKNTSIKRDNNEKLKLTVDGDVIKLSLDRILDNPVWIVDKDYKRTYIKEGEEVVDDKFQLNWACNSMDTIGKVGYAYITKEALESGKVSNAPSRWFTDGVFDYSEGMWFIDNDFGGAEPGHSASNNRPGSLQVAIAVGVEVKDGKNILNTVKAYRTRFISGVDDKGDDILTWTSWTYENTSDYRKDTPLRLISNMNNGGTVDVNWLHVWDKYYDSDSEEKYDSVTFHVIDKDCRELATNKAMGLFNLDGFKENDDDTVLITNYAVGTRGYGSCQVALSLKTGARAGRYVKDGTIDEKGNGSYSSWKLMRDSIDLSNYQTKSVTNKVYGTGTTKSDTVQGALDALSTSITDTKQAIKQDLTSYQTKSVDPTNTKLTATTVEKSLAELAGKCSTLSSQIKTLNGDVGAIGEIKFEDARNFGMYVKSSEERFVSEFKEQKAGSNSYFGVTMKFVDQYDGGEKLHTGDSLSNFISAAPEKDAQNKNIGIEWHVDNDALITPTYDKNLYPKYDNGIYYPYYELSYKCPGDANKTAKVKFYDFISESDYLYAFSTGNYNGNDWTIDKIEKLTQIETAMKTINSGVSLATVNQVNALFERGFKLWKQESITSTTVSDSTMTSILLTPVGDKISIGYKGLSDVYFVFQGGNYKNFNARNLTMTSGTSMPSVPSNTGYGAGAILVVKKSSLYVKPTDYDYHAQMDSRHITESEKKKIENLESIIAKMIQNSITKMMPIGTIIPYMQLKSDKTGVKSSIDYGLLAEYGGNWVVCDGKTHTFDGKTFTAPNLIGYAPVGTEITNNINQTKSATMSGTMTVRSQAYSRVDGGKNHYCMDGVVMNETTISARDGNKTVSYSVSGSATPGKTALYLIKVK